MTACRNNPRRRNSTFLIGPVDCQRTAAVASPDTTLVSRREAGQRLSPRLPARWTRPLNSIGVSQENVYV